MSRWRPSISVLIINTNHIDPTFLSIHYLTLNVIQTLNKHNNNTIAIKFNMNLKKKSVCERPSLCRLKSKNLQLWKNKHQIKKIKTWYYSVNIKAIKVKFSQCSLSYEGWFFFCRQKQITKKWVSHFNILIGFNDTLQTEVKIFYVEIISVLNLFQEYMASRPVVPQNHNDMADSLLFIPWYVYIYIQCQSHACPKSQTLDT